MTIRPVVGILALWAAAFGCAAPAIAIVSSNTGPSPPFSGSVINYLVGAGTFYGLGFYGTRARIANVEAGAIWNGHESLTGRVSHFLADPAIVATGTTQLGQYDWHATMVGQTLGGAGSYYTHQAGIAPTAELWSGSIATAWVPVGNTEFVGGFQITNESFMYPYVTAMRTGVVSGTTTLKAHVVNSSWGYADSAGRNANTIALDALAAENNVVSVFAAGNSGPSANTVIGPASGYNGIAVAALTGDQTSPVYSQAASFSSRGPGDFYNPETNTTVPNARATVDIAAPGDNLTLAFYGGLTGGHISGAAVSGTAFYIPNMDGTSFAAPIVAGGAALMVDAGELFVSSGISPEMLDARVIKAAMLATAKAPSGWNNGQSTLGSVITTTQALDHATGAGMLDLDTAYRLYVGDPSGITIGDTTYVFPGINTTLGVSGSAGAAGLALRGWDLGSVLNGGSSATNTYTLGQPLSAGDTLTAALTWFADRTVGSTPESAADVSLANLSLQVWWADDTGSQSLVAQSIAPYGTTEFLRFTAPLSGTYSLRVVGLEPVYDLGPMPASSTSYGLAWQTLAVPEPSALILMAIAAAVPAAGIVREACGRRRTDLRRVVD